MFDSIDNEILLPHGDNSVGEQFMRSDLSFKTGRVRSHKSILYLMEHRCHVKVNPNCDNNINKLYSKKSNKMKLSIETTSMFTMAILACQMVVLASLYPDKICREKAVKLQIDDEVMKHVKELAVYIRDEDSPCWLSCAGHHMSFGFPYTNGSCCCGVGDWAKD